MIPKRISLPIPPETKIILDEIFAGNIDSQKRLESQLMQRAYLENQLAKLDAEIDRLGVIRQCGSQDESQHVELYDGTLGVPVSLVSDHQRSIGQLQWLDLGEIKTNSDDPGNVAGRRWGSGSLIAKDLFITAGHCFVSGGGSSFPKVQDQNINPAKAAKLMKVNFNYQINAVTRKLRVEESFPITEMVEHFYDDRRDFAILRLGKNSANQFPGEKFGRLKVATKNLAEPGAMLCIIQHPAIGNEAEAGVKKVEAGPLNKNEYGEISYNSLDTNGGSSGAPILSLEGLIVGIHTRGGCTKFNGANVGVAIEVIRAASPTIRSL